MAPPTPDEPKDKQTDEQAAMAARCSEYLWQILPKIEIDPADIRVIQSPAGHDIWVHSPRAVDKKKDKAEKSRKSCPRNLKELQTVARRVRSDKKRQVNQEESVRGYVEEKYPTLDTEEQILKKRDNLIRYMNRYEHLLNRTR
jgi:hypothetical protein